MHDTRPDAGYDACVVASVRSKGGELKGGDGFRMLARYIGAFGTPNNEGATGKPEAIKMTAPVVTGTEEDDGYWFVIRKQNSRCVFCNGEIPLTILTWCFLSIYLLHTHTHTNTHTHD